MIMLKNSKIKTLRKFKYRIIPGLFKLINNLKAVFIIFAKPQLSGTFWWIQYSENPQLFNVFWTQSNHFKSRNLVYAFCT